jgi:hypothetical protein
MFLLLVEIFDSREIATAVWMALLAIYVICYAPTRAAFVALIKAAAKPKIVTPILVAAIIVCGLVWVLHRVGLWTVAELKDTIIWFLFTGIALLYRGVNTPHPDRVIHASVWDAIRLTVFAECFFNTYTFSLPIELVLLPLATLLGVALAFAQTDERYGLAASFLGWLLAALGIVVISATLWAAAHDPRQLLSVEAARRLITPIILGFVFVPVAYLMALIASYEQLFVPLKINSVPKPLRRYAKIRLVARLKHHLKSVVIAKRRLWIPLGRIETKREIRNLVDGLSVDVPAPVPKGVDPPSYEAGYKRGIESASTDFETRMKDDDRCDAIITENGYDRDGFYQGFEAGRQDFEFV